MKKFLRKGILGLAALSMFYFENNFNFGKPRVPYFTSFKLDEHVEKTLRVLGKYLEEEQLRCLMGDIDNRGNILINKIHMPKHNDSERGRVNYNKCPEGTLGTWHNHPSRNISTHENGLDIMCHFSGTDIENALDNDIPVWIVGVRDSYCWWKFYEIEKFSEKNEISRNIALKPIEGQYKVYQNP